MGAKVYVHNMMTNDDDDEVSGSVIVSQGCRVGMGNEFECGLVAKVME